MEELILINQDMIKNLFGVVPNISFRWPIREIFFIRKLSWTAVRIYYKHTGNFVHVEMYSWMWCDSNQTILFLGII